MKLKLFLCMFFLGVAPFHCHELKPKEWKTRDLLLFANPFVTFEPSRISKGHVHYFGKIDQLNYQEKNNLRLFLNNLKIFKGASTIIMTLLGLGKLKFNIFTIPGVCMSILNIEYLREINVFEKELNEVLKKDD